MPRRRARRSEAEQEGTRIEVEVELAGVCVTDAVDALPFRAQRHRFPEGELHAQAVLEIRLIGRGVRVGPGAGVTVPLVERKVLVSEATTPTFASAAKRSPIGSM
jgi:hypothetical protein